MKATLEFSLPEQEYEFRAAVAGSRLLGQLEEIRQVVRLHLKHGDPKDSAAKLEEIRGMVYQALLEYEA
jgi:hypothetical protein